jgi:hypothetical protein
MNIYLLTRSICWGALSMEKRHTSLSRPLVELTTHRETTRMTLVICCKTNNWNTCTFDHFIRFPIARFLGGIKPSVSIFQELSYYEINHNHKYFQSCIFIYLPKAFAAADTWGACGIAFELDAAHRHSPKNKRQMSQLGFQVF